MDKVQKHNSFNSNKPSSESYKNRYNTGLKHLHVVLIPERRNIQT
jgi:hypothetical protein